MLLKTTRDGDASGASRGIKPGVTDARHWSVRKFQMRQAHENFVEKNFNWAGEFSDRETIRLVFRPTGSGITTPTVIGDHVGLASSDATGHGSRVVYKERWMQYGDKRDFNGTSKWAKNVRLSGVQRLRRRPTRETVHRTRPVQP